MKRFIVIVFLLTSVFGYGQSTEKYNSVYSGYYRAEELFQKQQYGAAREEFRAFVNLLNQPNDPMYIKALYYEGISALELYNNDAVDLLKRFIQNYPETVFKNNVYFRLGNFYYRAKNYEDALSYYGKFKAADLESEYHNEYNFKLGYSHFQLNHFDQAKIAFINVKDTESQYASPSLYYYSHIEYSEKNYQPALDGFLKLEGDEAFGKVVPYYILQIYYLQGRYAEVTAYAPKLKNATVVNEKDISHLIGDSYYRTGKYDEAVIHLEAYDRLAETTRDDDYQLGYSYYKSGQFEKAVKIFDRVTRNEKDSLSQVSFYHIGECYLALKNNLNARSAFQKASEIEADARIQEDALYQFAVLSYKVDVNPFSEAIIAFETYLNRYPNSKRKEDVYHYLVNVYTSTNNYPKALESLDRVQNKDVTLKRIYQLIAFNHGVEQYQRGKYEDAIATFKLVEKYPINSQLSAKAAFWSADANYQLNKFANAISGYQTYLGMSGATSDLKMDAYYNIGYANLYKGDTTAAIESFRLYEQAKPANKRKLADAYLRLADSYFMRSENKSAINYYDQVVKLNVSNVDQALYYKGITLGVEGQSEGKVDALLNLVNNHTNSKYVQDALFEIAYTYKSIRNYPQSIKYFTQILKDYPNTSKQAAVRIELADLYYKENNYKKAEEEYLLVLEKFGHDTICNAVGEGLQHVYAATKQIAKLEQYAQKYPCLNINALTLENLLFNPAENDYHAKKYESAIPKFQEYLTKYPKGYHSKKALSYLADSYYELDDQANAVATYEILLKEETTNFTELAAIRSARYYYNNGEFAKAIPHYERMEHVSSDKEVIFNARLGLARSNYQVEEYVPAAAYAKLVLESNLLKQENRLETQYILGMSSYHTREYQDAISAFNFVSKNTTNAIASEAKFMIAQTNYDLGKYSDADQHAREVLKMKPTYDFWIAKALILQTKILVKKDDLFQAEQTILSVVQYYKVKDDGILDEAQQVYDEVMQLKNQPKSIAPTGNTEIEINE